MGWKGRSHHVLLHLIWNVGSENFQHFLDDLHGILFHTHHVQQVNTPPKYQQKQEEKKKERKKKRGGGGQLSTIWFVCVSVCVCVYVCMYVCMYVCVCVGMSTQLALVCVTGV